MRLNMDVTRKLNQLFLILFFSRTLMCNDFDWWYSKLLDSCQMKTINKTKQYFHILLWTTPNIEDKNATNDKYLRNFESNTNEKCIYDNCLFTHSKNFTDIDKFHAILFNGRTLENIEAIDLPEKRNQNQIYAFLQIESTMRYPITNKLFDDFFNMTMTYKLDSDVPSLYLQVHDKTGAKISPRRKKIEWKTSQKELKESFKRKLYAKTKLVAWFVSHCKTQSKRTKFVIKLNKALKNLGFNQTVDTYGGCGKLKCPISNNFQCTEMLSKDYMFYLSFENSFSEDYVTEKVLTAVQHDTVPIVYGGADYTRFLPPGSYIDACLLGPNYLASLLVHLYNRRSIYENYFKWRYLYKFVDPGFDSPVHLCKILNEGNYEKRHKKFLTWWNNDQIMKCHTNDTYTQEVDEKSKEETDFLE